MRHLKACRQIDRTHAAVNPSNVVNVGKSPMLLMTDTQRTFDRSPTVRSGARLQLMPLAAGGEDFKGRVNAGKLM